MMPRIAWPLCTSRFPRPTKAEVAQNRAEIDSRSESTTVQKLMGLMKKGPDVAQAAKVGDPPLVDPSRDRRERGHPPRDDGGGAWACPATMSRAWKS